MKNVVRPSWRKTQTGELTFDVQDSFARDFTQLIAGAKQIFSRVLRLDVRDEQYDDAVVVWHVVLGWWLDRLIVCVPRELGGRVGLQLHLKSEG